MFSGMFTAVAVVALGAGPYGYETTGPVYEGESAPQGAIDTFGSGPVGQYGSYNNGSADPLFPYDAPNAWQHGYFQEIPAYGGFNAFRPYNYKHVLSQSQAAGGWGMPPTMPYSQQFWHRYQDQAAMRQHLSQVGMTEYTAELARVRAQHDFEVQENLARRAASTPQGNVAARFPQTEGTYPAGAYGINPAGYQTPDRIEALQNQIRQQAEQLQALQRALEQERQTQPSRGYYQPAPGR